MLKTNKQKGIFVASVNAAFTIYSLIDYFFNDGSGVKFSLIWYYIAYWVYNLEEKEDTDEDH